MLPVVGDNMEFIGANNAHTLGITSYSNNNTGILEIIMDKTYLVYYNT